MAKTPYLCTHLEADCENDDAMKQIFMTLTVMLFTTTAMMAQKLYITVGDVTKTATLASNSATQALAAKLREAPVTVTLNSSGGFEIWGALGFSLPTSNEQMDAQPGDIVLYNGSNICMFYGTNSWSYTRLGHIDGLTESELRMFLKAGESNISVTLALSNATAIGQVRADDSEARAYTLHGTLAQAGYKGIVIRNGKVAHARTKFRRR